jgi:hypothetical protein
MVIKGKRIERVWGKVEVDMFWCLIIRESYFVQKLLERKCVCGIEHDEPYRYDGKINQDSDNLNGRSCNQEKTQEEEQKSSLLTL